jgi:hypothetical protein
MMCPTPTYIPTTHLCESDRNKSSHKLCRTYVLLKLYEDKVQEARVNYFDTQTLRMKGFSPKWYALINNFMSGGSVAIRVNDDAKVILCHQCYLT